MRGFCPKCNASSESMVLVDDGVYLCRCDCYIEERALRRKSDRQLYKDRLRARQAVATGQRGDKHKKQRQHGLKRADQRYGLTEKDYDRLIEQIKSTRNAVLVRKQNARLAWWDVLYKKRMIRCVYDRRRQVIVTLLFAEGEGQGWSDD